MERIQCEEKEEEENKQKRLVYVKKLKSMYIYY